MTCPGPAPGPSGHCQLQPPALIPIVDKRYGLAAPTVRRAWARAVARPAPGPPPLPNSILRLTLCSCFLLLQTLAHIYLVSRYKASVFLFLLVIKNLGLILVDFPCMSIAPRAVSATINAPGRRRWPSPPLMLVTGGYWDVFVESTCWSIDASVSTSTSEAFGDAIIRQYLSNT